MPIEITCGDCGKRYRVEDRLIGKKVKCRACGNVMTVPQEAEPRDEVEDSLAALEALARSGMAMDAAVEPPAWTPPAAPKQAKRGAPPLPPALTPAPALAYAAPALPAAAGYGATRQLGRSKKSAALGVDSATPMLIFFYLASCVLQLIMSLVHMSEIPADRRPPNLSGMIWTVVIANVVLFFAIVAPLTMLGVYITRKIFNFELVDSAYLRACGVAAVPGVILSLIAVLPANFALDVALLVAILPVTFYVLKFAFDLDMAGAVVAFLFSGIFYAGAQVVAKMMLGALLLGAMFGGSGVKNVVARGPSNLPSDTPRMSASDGDSSSGRAPVPSTPSDPEADKMASLRTELLISSEQAAQYDSREQLQPRLEIYRGQLEAMRQANAAKPQFTELERLLKTLESKVMAMPSEKPGEDIFTAPNASDVWDVGNRRDADFAREVSYKTFKIRPPKGFLLDLRSSEEDEKGLSWWGQKGWRTGVTISTLKRGETRQQRPWVAKGSIVARSESKNLFAVPAEDVTVSCGLIDKVPFTRIASKPSSGKHSQRWVKYVGLFGEDWLVIDVAADADDAQGVELLEASARTVRKAKANEERVDPFSPKLLAARLSDDAEHAVPLLRRQGAAAEEAVLPYLNSPDYRASRGAAQVLQEVATEKSAAALKQAAQTSGRDDTTAIMAAMKRISGEKFDEIDEAMVDLDSNDWQRQQRALKMLAIAKPDKRRNEVSKKIEDVILSKEGHSFFLRDDAPKALVAWAGDKTVTHLLTALSGGDRWGQREQRAAAMKVLGQLKDKRAVLPITRWLIEDDDNAVPALIEMGPIAEDEVIKVLREKDARGRANAARVLEAIGTRKCVDALSRAAKDPRNQRAALTAQAALEIVKERIKEQAASQPATQPG